MRARARRWPPTTSSCVPRPKRLEDFDYTANPNVPAALIHTLARGAWVAAGQPCCLIGDSGTGKSHLLIALGTAAAENGYRVRYPTAAALVNELVEAADDKTLSRTIARYGRIDLLCLDELGYLELDRRGAELLFQVFTEREERASVAIASNAAFSEWTATMPARPELRPPEAPMLISQAGSDYQAAQITLDAAHARDIMLMLLDVHAVLDHLYLDGTRPQATGPAQDYLRESDSPYTLPGLIGALDEVVSMLSRAGREAFRASPPPGSASHDAAPAACKRPGCPNTLPPPGRGRARQFCSDDCARRYHNDARIPAPAAAPAGDTDPLPALEVLLRQAAVLVRAAREQAASLDPAAVRAQIAEAEAARRRAEAAAVAQLRSDTAAQITAISARADEQAAAARTDADRCARERDDTVTAASQARHAADTEISRARQAETDARDLAAQLRADAARERDALGEHHQAQLAAAHALTQAERARAERAEEQLETERADRRTLTSHLTSTTSDNGQQPRPGSRGGARSK